MSQRHLQVIVRPAGPLAFPTVSQAPDHRTPRWDAMATVPDIHSRSPLQVQTPPSKQTNRLCLDVPSHRPQSSSTCPLCSRPLLPPLREGGPSLYHVATSLRCHWPSPRRTPRKREPPSRSSNFPLHQFSPHLSSLCVFSPAHACVCKRITHTPTAVPPCNLGPSQKDSILASCIFVFNRIR